MILKRMQDDLTTALKANQKTKVETIRYVLAQIKNKQIDSQTELNDEEITDILRKEGKKLQDSIDAFKAGGRGDLVIETQSQLEILEEYLPTELSDEDLMAEVEKIKQENLDLFKRNPNALIGLAVGKLKSQASPGRISAAVRSLQ